MCEACEDKLNDVDLWDNLFVAQGGTLSEQRIIQIAQEKILILEDCISSQWFNCCLRWLGRLIFFIIPSSILLFWGIQWFNGWGIFFTLLIMPQIFCYLITLYDTTERGVPGFFTVLQRTSFDRKMIKVLKEQIECAQWQSTGQTRHGWSSGHGSSQRPNTHGAPTLNTALADAYTLLGVSPNISDRELKKRYHQLMHDLHPDALSGANINSTLSALAEEQVKKLNSAYQLIVDSRKQGNW